MVIQQLTLSRSFYTACISYNRLQELTQNGIRHAARIPTGIFTIITVAVVFAVLECVLVATQLYARRLSQAFLGQDGYWIIVTLVCSSLLISLRVLTLYKDTLLRHVGKRYCKYGILLL